MREDASHCRWDDEQIHIKINTLLSQIYRTSNCIWWRGKSFDFPKISNRHGCRAPVCPQNQQVTDKEFQHQFIAYNIGLRVTRGPKTHTQHKTHITTPALPLFLALSQSHLSGKLLPSVRIFLKTIPCFSHQLLS
jgi:hypothetical protein